MKSRRRRWAGHVVRMGTGVVHTGFWWGNLREGNDLEDLGTDGSLTFKKKSGMGKHGLD